MIRDELCSRFEEALKRNKELFKENIRIRGIESSSDREINVRIIRNFENIVKNLSGGDNKSSSFTIDKNPFNMKSAEFSGKECGVLIERPDGSKEMISVLRG